MSFVILHSSSLYHCQYHDMSDQHQNAHRRKMTLVPSTLKRTSSCTKLIYLISMPFCSSWEQFLAKCETIFLQTICKLFPLLVFNRNVSVFYLRICLHFTSFHSRLFQGGTSKAKASYNQYIHV